MFWVYLFAVLCIALSNETEWNKAWIVGKSKYERFVVFKLYIKYTYDDIEFIIKNLNFLLAYVKDLKTDFVANIWYLKSHFSESV